MALTDTQKAQIRLYLGYPDGFRFKHTRLESVLDNLSPEAETLIGTLLTNLATIEARILAGATNTSLSVMMAGLKRVDEIWFETGTTKSSTVNAGFQNLKDAGKYYVGRISVITGVPIYSNVFGGGGYLGDDFFPGLGTPINLG